ncbi:MAG: hypothetical protein WCF65_06515 [Parachlamydiaceae bacterium]
MSQKQSSADRQKAVQELIKKMTVSDQIQLVELLREHYSIETNQAVISRDLRKLGVIKKIVNGTPSYEMPDIDVSAEILKLALVDISHNESMIVINTHPALADFVGDCVDQYNDLGVLGCLSGENVVFITPKSTKNIKKTYEKICERFHFKKKKDA